MAGARGEEIKYVVLDLDGNLTMTQKVFTEVFGEVKIYLSGLLGVDVKKISDEWEQAWSQASKHAKVLPTRIIGSAIGAMNMRYPLSNVQWGRVADLVMTVYEKPVELYSDVVEGLDMLLGKYSLAVCSQGQRWWTEKKVQDSGLYQFVECVYSARTDVSKGSMAWREASDYCGYLRRKSVAVGDNKEGDCLGAIYAGYAHAIHVQRPKGHSWIPHGSGELVNTSKLPISTALDMIEAAQMILRLND